MKATAGAGFALLVSAFLTLVVAVALAPGQDEACDPHLLELATAPPLGYAPRPDGQPVCEGQFRQEKSGGALAVVSFTASVESYDLKAGKDLVVEWTPVRGERVRLRAQSLRPRQYYRMDTVRAPGEAVFRWAPGVLAALDIARSHLGVVAWAPTPVGGTRRDVYLPVRIGQLRSPRPSATYELVLLSNVELREVYQTLTLLGTDGRPARVLHRDAPLGLTYYPANRPISVSIGDLPRPATYQLDLGAPLRQGGTSSVTMWFRHP